MASRVRSHKRRTASGGTTRVTQHNRRGRPRKALLSAGHAWALLRKAWRANRRRKRAVAAVLAVLGLAELVAWLTLQGTSLILLTAGMLAIAVATLAAGLGGVQR
jgi:diacylglycerol kinase